MKRREIEREKERKRRIIVVMGVSRKEMLTAQGFLIYVVTPTVTIIID